MKRVEPHAGSGKTLTGTLLTLKASYFRKVCYSRADPTITGSG
jgi:hypothetical protein